MALEGAGRGLFIWNEKADGSIALSEGRPWPFGDAEREDPEAFTTEDLLAGIQVEPERPKVGIERALKDD